MKRNNSDILPVNIVTPAALSVDNTPVAIDLIDAASNMIVVHMGVGGITFTGTNKIDVIVTHSDDGTNFSAVGQEDVIINGDEATAMADTATGNVKSFTTAHAAATLDRIEYIGNKRYIKVLVDFGGTHGSPTPIGVFLIQSRLHLAGTTV